MGPPPPPPIPWKGLDKALVSNHPAQEVVKIKVVATRTGIMRVVTRRASNVYFSTAVYVRGYSRKVIIITCFCNDIQVNIKRVSGVNSRQVKIIFVYFNYLPVMARTVLL